MTSHEDNKSSINTITSAERLKYIIHQFTATHEFIRERGFSMEQTGVTSEMIWERLFNNNYPDCVSSMEALRAAQLTNITRHLYNSTMLKFHEEFELIQQEWETMYPKKIQVVLSSPTQAHQAPTQAHLAPTQVLLVPTQVLLEPTQALLEPTQAHQAHQAHQANLVYFDNKFYGKNPDGSPNEKIKYKHPTPINDINNNEIKNTIVTLAEILLSNDNL
jgi:hypothetical protein